MSDNMQSADAYVRKLQEQRRAYQQFVKERVEELFQDDHVRERRPPRHFVDSSFLYARSFVGDVGVRPFGNIMFWLSPDILVSPITSPAAYTRTLTAGQTYNLRCILRNRGDLGVPSAKVEFWLTDPTLGFDTRYARHLTLGRVPTAWVGANATAEVNVAYTVPPSEAGHKCLFARAFSFSPLDVPVDDTRLDPRVDRHVAQLNLNIVQQGQPFMFQWIHAPNARAHIQFAPLEVEALLGLNHPILAETKPFRDIPTREWDRITGLEVADTEARTLEMDRAENGLMVAPGDPEGVDIQTQHEVAAAVYDVLEQVAAGKTHTSEHRDLFRRFREVNSEARRTWFKMEAPDLGLGEGEVVGVDLRAVDLADDRAGWLGGMTLLIVG
jgi:hypothetical protein